MTATQRLNWTIALALGSLSIGCGVDGSANPIGIVEQELDGASAAQPYRACNVKDDCEGNVPACTHGTNYFCNTTAHQCAYYLKNLTGCSCVEGVIRECQLDGGMGVQRCNELAGGKTNWGVCGTLAEALDDG